MKKNIILIGSNSNFVKNVLNEPEFLTNYNKIYLLSHRSYNGKNNKYNIVENINPFYLVNILKEIFDTYSTKIKWDILVSNTPPQMSNFNDMIIKEWSFTTLKIMNYLSFSSNVNKVIFLGSCLSFVPLFNNCFYKSLKKIEFQMFHNLNFYNNNNNKICYCILPPLKPGVVGLGKFFSQDIKFWSKKIMNEFDETNKLILPSGLIGVILKTILITKLVKL